MQGILRRRVIEAHLQTVRSEKSAYGRKIQPCRQNLQRGLRTDGKSSLPQFVEAHRSIKKAHCRVL
jgi:hypothetical protein